MISTSEKTTDIFKTIPLRSADDAALVKISTDGILSLTLAEMKAIQTYFNQLDRDPTDVELETIAQTWSEHCKHKTFRAAYTYEEKNLDGEKALAPSGKKQYGNLLKDTVVQTTEQLSPAWCLSVFKDNAGVIDFDQDDAVSFKVETHNHPSALEPYGGAGTGIGGVIRDILGCGLGGKPVLNTDVFCFGHLDTPATDLPAGAHHPKKIARGVISGVRDYGNRMGIPTANGSVYFDPGYIGNPLVFCGTVGLMPKSTIDKTVQPGDLVVVMGGRTGRDGIHGATFSSAPLESGITSNVVQIGHAIMEKKTQDVLLVARDKNLYRSVTDCGAGGFSSAIGELGEETGVKVDLARAPLKYDGLKPWEIWLSESQERMVCAVPPENWNSLKNLFDQENVEAVVVGEFTDNKKLVVEYDGHVVADMDMEFVHGGLPAVTLAAAWDSAEQAKRYQESYSNIPPSLNTKVEHDDVGKVLEALLAHPVIASKERVIRQYDHEVQGGSIIKPLMGPEADGPTDACVIRPKLSSWKGVAVSNGLCPEMGKYDPYLMAKYAIDEALRNLIAVGGHLRHVAILDNFCWGDTQHPQDLAALVRAAEGCKEMALAYELPFISGKDSFHNTWKKPDGQLQPIPPTLLISAMGIIEDVRECISSGIKGPGKLLYLVGETHQSMKGSLAGILTGHNEGAYVDIDPQKTKPLYTKLRSAMRSRLIESCHDLSEGGVAVAAAEMAFGGDGGIQLTMPASDLSLTAFLFSEAPSRFLVEIEPSFQSQFENLMGSYAVQKIGETISSSDFVIQDASGQQIYKEKVKSLKEIWKSALAHL